MPGQHGDRMLAAPLNETYIHRQTLASVYRFTTTELGELESRIAASAERALAIEAGIFESLTTLALAQGESIKTVGGGHGDARLSRGACRTGTHGKLVPPRCPTTPQVLQSRQVANPVVEAALKKSGRSLHPQRQQSGRRAGGRFRV